MPDSVKADCERLASLIVSFAAKMLGEQGGFHPFGSAMALDGEFVSVVADDERASPPHDELIRLIKEACANGAREGKYRATALACNVRLTDPDSGEAWDNVAVSLDHRDDYSVVMFLPYEIDGGTAVFRDDAIVETGADDIFRPKTLS